MLIPKKQRQTIYLALFQDGVMVAHKDYNAPKHSEVETRNLFVIKAMQSLKSRGYVIEKFAWRHFYWYLTEDGINYLREFLHLPAEVIPNTHKRQAPRARPAGAPASGEQKPREGGDRDAYRRGGDAAPSDKKAGAESDFKPGFHGGYASAGRGGPRGRGTSA